MIKSVVFDIGGVCVSGSMQNFYLEACEYLNIPPTRNFEQSPIIQEEYNKGLISARDAFDRLFGMILSDEQFLWILKLWKGTFVKKNDTYELVDRLKKNGYRLAILSNSDDAVSSELEKQGLYDDFEIKILSHEQGILKPDPKIYDVLIKFLGLKPAEIVFIDDVQVNVDTATKLGINAIKFKDIGQVVKELKKLGVDCD